MKLRKIEVPFTQVANNVLADISLSWKAKGLFSYLASKPDGWDFASKRIANEGSEGVKSTNTGLQELEENGYLIRNRQASGRMEYVLSYEKVAKNSPESQNVTMPKRQSAKKDSISNKESISNKDKKKDIIINPENKFSEDSFEYQISDYFLSYHLEKIKTASVSYQIEKEGKDKVLQKYADVVEKLKRVDGYNETQIDFIVKYTLSQNRENFPGEKFYWAENIQSMEKFREKNAQKIPYFVVMIDHAKTKRDSKIPNTTNNKKQMYA